MRGAVAALLLAGCFAQHRFPSPAVLSPMPATISHPLQACLALQDRNQFHLSAAEQAQGQTARAALQRLVPVRVEVGLRDFAAVEATHPPKWFEEGQALLRGEIIPISLRVAAQGTFASALSLHAEVIVDHDGTTFANATRPMDHRSTDLPPHDVVRALFARATPPPMPPASQRTTAVGAGTRRLAWRDERERLSLQTSCIARGPNEPCQALVPLGRTAPSLGPERFTLRLFFTFSGAAACSVSDWRSAPLPPGATLPERLRALFADGPLTL